MRCLLLSGALAGLEGKTVVLVNVGGLPWVAAPLIIDGFGGDVAALVEHFLGKDSVLWLILVL